MPAELPLPEELDEPPPDPEELLLPPPELEELLPPPELEELLPPPELEELLLPPPELEELLLPPPLLLLLLELLELLEVVDEELEGDEELDEGSVGPDTESPDVQPPSMPKPASAVAPESTFKNSRRSSRLFSSSFLYVRREPFGIYTSEGCGVAIAVPRSRAQTPPREAGLECTSGVDLFERRKSCAEAARR